jgi:glycosyltransferase involved in cell wall biosynthesis
MRVLIASHSAGLRGGAERCVSELATALRGDGRVEPIVTMPMRGELTRALELSGVETRVMPAPTWLVDPSPAWPHDPLRAARRLKRLASAVRAVPRWNTLLRAERPDVVLSSTTVSPTAAIASRRTGVPHVWWIHEFTTLGLGKQYALGESASQRLIDALSARVAVNSAAVAAHYSPPIAARKVATIELGVEPPPVAANDAADGKLRALVLGRKDPEKGCETAIRAVAALRDEDVDVQLRMVGPALAGYAETLWYLARDLGVLERVELVEYTPDPTPHFEWSNVVLVPSYGEAFGRVTVEALKSGRPVIGARAGATVDLVAEGCNGLLVTPGDANELASALRRCAREPELVDKMSTNAVAATADRFTMHREVDTFVALFRQLRRA